MRRFAHGPSLPWPPGRNHLAEVPEPLLQRFCQGLAEKDTYKRGHLLLLVLAVGWSLLQTSVCLAKSQSQSLAAVEWIC